MSSSGKIPIANRELLDSAMSTEFVRQFKPQKKSLPTKEIDVFSPLQVGTKLGLFEIITELGRGGMGVVYQAHETTSGRIVALKILSNTDASAQRRFEREARAMAQLKHPHIIEIYQIGRSNDRAYFVMPFIEGTTLSQAMQPKMVPQRAAKIVAKIAQALHYAHSKGVIHRDLKPGNIMLSREGDPYIMDFGLAKVAGDAMEVTRTGDVVGTFRYMPPEQAAGKIRQIDERSDVYSLGVVLYEMLTGRVPIEANNTLLLLDKICNVPPEPLHKINPQISPELEKICLRALAKQPKKRYQSAQKMAQALQEWLRGGQQKRSRNLSPQVFILSMALLFCLGISMLLLLASVPKKNTSGKKQATPQKIQPQSKENLPKAVKPTIPNHWSPKLWDECWSETTEYLDFTAQSWLDLPAEQQMQYASAYQQWYAQRQEKPVEKTIDLAKGVGIKVVLIPPGKFWMGSPPDERGRDSHEPYQQVIVKAFWMGKHELTQRQWQTVMGNRPWQEKPEVQEYTGISGEQVIAKANHPATFISFSDFLQFAKNLQRGSSIPTTQQWEYACRAGVTRRFFWGDSLEKFSDYANVGDAAMARDHPLVYKFVQLQAMKKSHQWEKLSKIDDGFAGIAPVGSKLANSFGLFDVIGNASEWCCIPSDPKAQILRGSNWSCVAAEDLRVARLPWIKSKTHSWHQYGARIAFQDEKEVGK